MKKIRLKDIAALADVSESAVSLVLNDAPTRISEKKKEEIKRIAKELNYVPNYAARSLSTQKSQTIGLIIPDIENPYFSTLSKRIEDLLRESGYLVFIVNSNDSFNNDLSLLKEFVHRMVDGIMICPSNESYENIEKMTSVLRETKVPLILLDRVFEEVTFNQVSYDNELGGYLATKFLIDSGCKKIACFSGSLKTVNGHDRLKGYMRALKESGQTYHDNLVFEGDYQFESGYRLGKKVLDIKTVDGVFSCNDLMAFGLIRAMSERGISQQQLQIVGYDNLKQADMFGIELRSVDQDIYAMATAAVNQILKIIDNPSVHDEIILEPTLA